MDNQHLITMANQIGQFFETNGANGQRDAAEHIQKFWAPSMREAMTQLLPTEQARDLTPFMRTALTNMEK